RRYRPTWAAVNAPSSHRAVRLSPERSSPVRALAMSSVLDPLSCPSDRSSRTSQSSPDPPSFEAVSSPSRRRSLPTTSSSSTPKYSKPPRTTQGPGRSSYESTTPALAPCDGSSSPISRRQEGRQGIPTQREKPTLKNERRSPYDVDGVLSVLETDASRERT